MVETGGCNEQKTDRLTKGNLRETLHSYTTKLAHHFPALSMTTTHFDELDRSIFPTSFWSIALSINFDDQPTLWPMTATVIVGGQLTISCERKIGGRDKAKCIFQNRREGWEEVDLQVPDKGEGESKNRQIRLLAITFSLFSTTCIPFGRISAAGNRKRQRARYATSQRNAARSSPCSSLLDNVNMREMKL